MCLHAEAGKVHKGDEIEVCTILLIAIYSIDYQSFLQK